MKKFGLLTSSSNLKIHHQFWLAIFTCIIFISTIHCQQEQQGVQQSQSIFSPSDGQITYSQRIKINERQAFKKNQQKVQHGTRFKQFLFTLKGVDQFLLNLPVAQQVAINIYTYIVQDNAYIRPKQIQNQPPVRVYIYENNNRIIHNSEFFFQQYVIFQGLSQSTYMIRFLNAGPQKLINMNVKILTELTHVQQIVDKKDAQKHSKRSGGLQQDFRLALNGFQRYSMINQNSMKKILEGIALYFYYEIFQTLIAVVVCITQITLIKKICNRESVV